MGGIEIIPIYIYVYHHSFRILLEWIKRRISFHGHIRKGLHSRKQKGKLRHKNPRISLALSVFGKKPLTPICLKKILNSFC